MIGHQMYCGVVKTFATELSELGEASSEAHCKLMNKTKERYSSAEVKKKKKKMLYVIPEKLAAVYIKLHRSVPPSPHLYPNCCSPCLHTSFIQWFLVTSDSRPLCCSTTQSHGLHRHGNSDSCRKHICIMYTISYHDSSLSFHAVCIC